MDLPARLSEQLSLLALGGSPDGSGLVTGLSTLVTTLGEAVSGYAGLRLTIVHSDQPVRLTAMLPPTGEPVVTSVRVPLPSLSTSSEQGGRLVVWSTVAGSLVDLAADLGYVLRPSAGAGARRAPPVLELDADLPAPGPDSGVDGLDELATLHRAAGVLIARGHHPDSVQDVLRRGAAREGVSTVAWADRLLTDPAGLTP